MSLFGSQTAQAPSSGGFGSANAPQQKGGLFGQTQQGGGPLFGSTSQQNPQSSPFGGLGQQQQQQQQQSTSGPFSGLGSSTQQPQQQGGGLFAGLGSSTQQQPQQPQQQQGLGIFPNAGQQQPQPQQQQQSQGGLFPTLGSTTQPQPQPQPQQPQSQLSQTVSQSQGGGSTIWTPGQGMTGVHRTVPMQMMIVKDKWDPVNRASPFRAYTYNNATGDTAPFFQPGPNEDETKWEEALRNRPGPNYVPVLVQGFWELGKRAQRQRDFLSMMQNKLHHLNSALTELLSRHDLNISVKIAACRRKHKVLSQRCLAVAAKTQVLRNRGYAMDDTEEELQKKLNQLERSVFDPSLNGRSEEIWARMLAIREHSRQLQQGLERIGGENGVDKDDTLDDSAVKMAKKILDDYAVQIEHLNKELTAVQKDVESLQQPATA